MKRGRWETLECILVCVRFGVCEIIVVVVNVLRILGCGLHYETLLRQRRFIPSSIDALTRRLVNTDITSSSSLLSTLVLLNTFYTRCH